MRLSIQSLLGSSVLGLALVGIFLHEPVTGQVPGGLPVIDKLEHKSYTETMPGTAVKFDMVAVPGGVFLMGSPDGAPGRKADEGPQHLVQLRPYWMGKIEVTWDEFDVYRKEKGVDNPEDNDRKLKAKADAITGPTPPYVDETYGHGREGHPALCMTHHCAMEYCRWLAQKTGKLHRLPTEAEWEWACRAGTKSAYSFGDDPKQLGDFGWYVKNSAPNANEDPQTHKCGTRKPNAWGLFDMHGNIAEWCLDFYEKDYSKFPRDQLTLAPVLVPTNKRFSHVVRGGSWSDEAPLCRSAARVGSDKTWLKDDPQRPQSIWWLTNKDIVGLRVVRAVEEQENLKGVRSKVTRESD